MDKLETALGRLRTASVPGEERARERAKTNAHVHLPPNFSAFETLVQALDMASQEGVRLLGAGNYYDFTVYAELIEAALTRGIVPLLGTEIVSMMDDLREAGQRVNDPGNPGKAYLCGKGIVRLKPMSAEAAGMLGRIREGDDARMARMVTALNALFAAAGIPTGLSVRAIVAQVAERHGAPPDTVHLQERHLARAYQEGLFAHTPAKERAVKMTQLFGKLPKADLDDAVAVQGEIRSNLMKAGKPAFVEEQFVSFEEACRLVVELGGVPVYPVLADGAKPIPEFEATPQVLVENLKARGIRAAEFIPLRNEPSVLEEYVLALRSAGIVVSAGTEHNTLDLVPIEPACKRGEPVPKRVAEVFWEGACVLLGHQMAALRDEPGLTESAGEDDLSRLRMWGESMIARIAGA